MKKVPRTSINRRELVLKKMSENVRNKSLYRAQVEAGYSESYAKTGRIKNTKSWKNMVDERLSDDLIISIHEGVLKAKRLMQIDFDTGTSNKAIKNIMAQIGFNVLRIFESGVDYANSKGVIIRHKTKKCFYAAPDTIAMNKAIDMAYRLKDKYPKSRIETKSDRPLKDLTDEELALLTSEGIKFLRKQ